jgi:hypothetical protein
MNCRSSTHSPSELAIRIAFALSASVTCTCLMRGSFARAAWLALQRELDLLVSVENRGAGRDSLNGADRLRDGERLRRPGGVPAAIAGATCAASRSAGIPNSSAVGIAAHAAVEARARRRPRGSRTGRA